MMNIQCKKCKATNTGRAAFCKKCGFPLETKSLSLEGKRVGNYQLLTRIGGGGFGEVYRAEHAELGNPFAVKILHPRLAQDPQFVERFRHEAMVLAGLQHENVVQVVDFGQKDDIGFYLVMEWLEGRTLHRIWRQKRVLSQGKIYALFSQLLDALQLAHDSGIVHRDMKPENLILTKGSRGRTILKIVDFGIATIISGSNDKSDPLNKRGMAIGTPYYMSPEQAAGRLDKVDHRSDLYACGVIFVELLVGRRLFRSKDAKDILRQQIETPPPRLDQLNPNRQYPESFQQIVDKALAKRREERFNSATEFFQAVQKAMDDAGILPIEEDEYSSPSSSNLLSTLVTSDDMEAFTTGQNSGGHSHGHQAISSQNSPSSATSSAISSAASSAISSAASSAISSIKNIQTTHKKTLYITLILGFLLLLTLAISFSFSPSSESIEPLIPAPPSLPLSYKNVGKKPDVRENLSKKKKQNEKQNEKQKKKQKKKQLKVVSKKTKKIRYRWLFIRTKPSRVRVYINYKYRGKTPKKVYIPYRMKVKVRLRKRGFMTKKFIWRARRNEKKRITLIEELF